MAFYKLLETATQNLEEPNIKDINNLKQALGGFLEDDLRLAKYNADVCLLLKMLTDYGDINKRELTESKSRGKYHCRTSILGMVKANVETQNWSEKDQRRVYKKIDELEEAVKTLRKKNSPSGT